MPSECCVEYILIQLYQKSSVWCFAFSHASTFELIPAVATAQPGAMVTVRHTAVDWTRSYDALYCSSICQSYDGATTTSYDGVSTTSYDGVTTTSAKS